jgi:hypothetical protein
MNEQVSSFLREALNRAVGPVGSFKAASSQLRIKDVSTGKQMWIVTQYVGGRHGCGSEQDGFWAHSNDLDLFAGSRGYTIEVVKRTTEELIEATLAGLAKQFADTAQVQVFIKFSKYPYHDAPSALKGSSSFSKLIETTEDPEN